jgi:D-alanyl-D-alanine dipeptidase
MKIGAPEPIAALNRVKILETGEPLVDIRDFCPAVHVMERACSYLRRTVAEMLNRAAESLPPGHRLRVGTALRTLAMQKAGWDGYFKRVQEEHPNWPLSTLRRATNRFFAPYDQPAPPGHCTGGAVDVQLLGPDGEPLDVTSPTQGWEAAYTWSDKISPEAKRNRMIMVNAMLEAGFSNCREEFWHYSWGDSAWAARVGEKTCPYGLILAPVAVEARYEGAFAEDIRQTGESGWTFRPVIAPEEKPRLDIGIFWTQGKEVTLRIEWPPPAPDTLYLSADRKTWEPVAPSYNSEVPILTLVPTADRVFLASEPPPENGQHP